MRSLPFLISEKQYSIISGKSTRRKCEQYGEKDIIFFFMYVCKMAYETYGQINGVIREIQRGDSCCSQILRLDTENGEVRFTVMAETMVIENVRLRRGMRVAAFYDTSLPVPAIYPPQYRAEIVTVLRGEQNVMLNFFDENLVAEDNSLRLNLSPVTNIMTQNGQRFTCSPRNMELLVYYTNTTFSIPPMTTPQKVIVMCEM